MDPPAPKSITKLTLNVPALNNRRFPASPMKCDYETRTMPFFVVPLLSAQKAHGLLFTNSITEYLDSVHNNSRMFYRVARTCKIGLVWMMLKSSSVKQSESLKFTRILRLYLAESRWLDKINKIKLRNVSKYQTGELPTNSQDIKQIQHSWANLTITVQWCLIIK